MSQLFSHLVFSYETARQIKVSDLKVELHAYLGRLIREMKGKTLLGKHEIDNDERYYLGLSILYRPLSRAW